MTDLAAVIAAVGGLAAFVTALGTIIVSWRNARAADAAALAAAIAVDRAEEVKRLAAEQAEHAKRELMVIGDAIVEVGKQVDGRLTKLLEAETRAARAEGRADGIAEEQARTAKVLGKLATGKPVSGADALAAVHGTTVAAPIDVHVIQHVDDDAVRVVPEEPRRK